MKNTAQVVTIQVRDTLPRQTPLRSPQDTPPPCTSHGHRQATLQHAARKLLDNFLLARRRCDRMMVACFSSCLFHRRHMVHPLRRRPGVSLETARRLTKPMRTRLLPPRVGDYYGCWLFSICSPVGCHVLFPRFPPHLAPFAVPVPTPRPVARDFLCYVPSAAG